MEQRIVLPATEFQTPVKGNSRIRQSDTSYPLKSYVFPEVFQISEKIPPSGSALMRCIHRRRALVFKHQLIKEVQLILPQNRRDLT